MHECSIAACAAPVRCVGLCARHYQKALYVKRHGARPTPDERFWSKVDKTSGCWLWTAGLDMGGYGVFSVTHLRTVKAHRWAYEQARGVVPEGKQLDHLCRNRRCVNPEHLDPVTCQTNLLRGRTFQAANAAKTHCPRGHAYAEFGRLYRGRRHCRRCEWLARRGLKHPV